MEKRIIEKSSFLSLFVLLSFFISSCASTQICTIQNNGKFEISEDEARLWKREKELQEILKNSGFIYEDEYLVEYLNGVLHRLVGNIEEVNNVKLSVSVIKDPAFNAFCLANGSIYLHTAIIAGSDNEAQIATVLGHEASHFLYRHALKDFRSQVNKSAFLSTLSIICIGVSSGLGVSGYGYSVDLAKLLVDYSVIGSVYGYSREMEREADKNAFDIIVKAGYDPLESKKFLENLYDATKDDKVKIPYFYYTHPKTKERIKNYEGFIRELSKTSSGEISGLKNEEAFNKAVKNLLLDNAELEIKSNKVRLARRHIQRYDNIYKGDFKTYYLSGVIYIQENNKKEAEKELKKSIELNPEYSESRRELGMLYYKQGEKQLAKPEFEKYLQLKPEAKDAAYIRGYLNEKEN